MQKISLEPAQTRNTGNIVDETFHSAEWNCDLTACARRRICQPSLPLNDPTVPTPER